MELQAVDGSKLLVLMIAGAVIAAAGLYLMLKPKPEDAAKIEIFGLKFESSSAGLLVFVVGAAFLSVPLFVPERAPSGLGNERLATAQISEASVDRAPEREEEATVDNASKEQAGESADLNATHREKSASVVKESEPNDTMRTAMPISIGQVIAGHVERNTDTDWFVLEIPSAGIKGHEVRLRHVDGGGNAYAGIYNGRQEKVGYLETRDGAKYLKISSDFLDKLFFHVERTNYGTSADYELTVLEPTGD